MSAANIPDGQLLAAILELIERDSTNNKLFNSPAISLEALAASLHVRPSSLDPDHVSNLIRPLAETATLFGVPRSPVVRVQRKGFGKEIWIVFNPAGGGKETRYLARNQDQQVRPGGKDIPRPLPIDLPLPTPPIRSRSRSQSRPTTPAVTHTTQPPLPAPLSRSKSCPQTPVLPRPPLRRVRSDHHVSAVSPPIPSAPLPLPPTKELHLIPTLPGGLAYRSQPRSAELRGEGGTPKRGLFKAFGLSKKREEDIPQMIQAISPTRDPPASEATPKGRRYETHVRALSNEDPYDSIKDVPRPLPLTVATQTDSPADGKAQDFLFPPQTVAPGRLRDDRDQSEHRDDDASFEIVSSYGDDDDGNQQEIAPENDVGSPILVEVSQEEGENVGEGDEDPFTYDSDSKSEIESPDEGRAGTSPIGEQRQADSSGEEEHQYRSSRTDEEPDGSDQVPGVDARDKRKHKHKHKHRREEAKGQVEKEERRRQRRLHNEKEEDKGERDGRHRDKGKAEGEEGQREARKHRHEERKRLRAEEQKSRSSSRSHVAKLEHRHHHHHERHRSASEDEDEERPPTPWLAVAFDELPFGPDPNSMQLSSWMRERWRLILAELVGVLGLVYIIQATGL